MLRGVQLASCNCKIFSFYALVRTEIDKLVHYDVTN